MTENPRYGQRAYMERREQCPKHPDRSAVAYCKRCNRPACADCAIATEVGSICVDCAQADRKQRRRGRPRSAFADSGAPVTTTLVAINVLVFVAQQFSPMVIQYLGFTPGAGYFQPWRLLTTAFLHGGFFHLLFNMLMLYLIGSSVEKAVGWWRYLAIYFLSALGGSMAIIGWVLVQPETVGQLTVGASGALYGIFGAVFVVQRKSGMSTTSILVLLGVNLAYGFMTPGISWQAHIGGFIAGLLVTLVYIRLADYVRGRSYRSVVTLDVATTVGLVAVFALGTWGLYALMAHSLLTG